MLLREKKNQIISTQHLQVIKVNTWSIFIEQAGRFPALKSPYLRRFLKTRKNLRTTSGMYSVYNSIVEQDLTVGSYHLTIIQSNKRTLSGNGTGWPFNATLNSIMQDCFTIRLWAKRLCRCTPKVTSWPRTPPVSLLHSKGIAHKEWANCYGLYAKRQLIIPAAIRAVYSRDNIY